MKKKDKIRYQADNRFSQITGLPVIKLTGKHPCWICATIRTNNMPVKKIAYAALMDWPLQDIHPDAKRFKKLKVKQTCVIDQCVAIDCLQANVDVE